VFSSYPRLSLHHLLAFVFTPTTTKTEVSSVPRSDLISDPVKAQSYVDNALKPLLAIVQDATATAAAAAAETAAAAAATTPPLSPSPSQSSVSSSSSPSAVAAAAASVAAADSAAAAAAAAMVTGAVVIEVINEPEWCMDDTCGAGVDTSACVAVEAMQGFVALQAAAVREAGFKVNCVVVVGGWIVVRGCVWVVEGWIVVRRHRRRRLSSSFFLMWVVWTIVVGVLVQRGGGLDDSGGGLDGRLFHSLHFFL
jgi:hypothetical protein